MKGKISLNIKSDFQTCFQGLSWSTELILFQIFLSRRFLCSFTLSVWLELSEGLCKWPHSCVCSPRGLDLTGFTHVPWNHPQTCSGWWCFVTFKSTESLNMVLLGRGPGDGKALSAICFLENLSHVHKQPKLTGGHGDSGIGMFAHIFL